MLVRRLFHEVYYYPILHNDITLPPIDVHFTSFCRNQNEVKWNHVMPNANVLSISYTTELTGLEPPLRISDVNC